MSVDAATGRHLWDLRAANEITLNVVGAIEPSLRHAEMEHLRDDSEPGQEIIRPALRADADHATIHSEISKVAGGNAYE